MIPTHQLIIDALKLVASKKLYKGRWIKDDNVIQLIIAITDFQDWKFAAALLNKAVSSRISFIDTQASNHLGIYRRRRHKTAQSKAYYAYYFTEPNCKVSDKDNDDDWWTRVVTVSGWFCAQYVACSIKNKGFQLP